MDIQALVLRANNFSSFNPMQEKVLEKQPFRKSLVVSAPTASGKTLVAELLSLHCILKEKKRVIYTGPLRALASEHYNDFKKKYFSLGIKATISTGDFDSSSQHLQNYGIIFTTYEKLNSLLRHRAPWLAETGLLVVDEIHEIDSGRGATLEITIAQMKTLCPGISVLALSATIPNAREIAKWLSAELVESDYRPIPLAEGVHYNEKLHFEKHSEQVKGKEALIGIIQNTLAEKKKQALVFANTRKRAESIAKQSAKTVQGLLDGEEKKLLEKDSEKILNALEQATEQCKALSELVKHGVAFHHAGLLQKQREIIEHSFRANRLKVISATPTLAAGVNLPSHTVIIPSAYRYGSFGMEKIPVREYKQMSGRAGRPKYDTEGRSLLIAKSETEMQEMFEEYVDGEIEEASSKLGFEPVLRMHLLGLIASNYVFDLASMEEFFSRTLFAKQGGGLSSLFEKLQKILSELQEMGFVESSGKSFKATRLGSRVSELYLDPLSAHKMVLGLKARKTLSEIAYLFILSDTFEFFPHFPVAKSREAELWEKLQASSSMLPVDVEREMFLDTMLLHKFNSAMVLNEWISETSEEELLKQYSVQPGILFSKLQICNWLCYSLFELAKLLGLEEHLVATAKLGKRIKHGVREELVFLTELKGIGRVRARRLFKARIRTISDLKKADIQDLKKIIGAKTAASVKAALGQS